MKRFGPFRSFVRDVEDPSDRGLWVRVIGVESVGRENQVYGLTVTIGDDDPVIEHWYDLAERALELQMREKGVWPS